MNATCDNGIGVRLTLLEMVLADTPRRIAPPLAKRITTGDYRAKAEALLDKSDGVLLARVWQMVFPCATDALPDRRGMIEDLADFAEVLRPSLHGMQANKLCRLIAAYAANRNRSQGFVKRLIRTLSRPSGPRAHVSSRA
jgi:hypothetical protein